MAIICVQKKASGERLNNDRLSAEERDWTRTEWVQKRTSGESPNEDRMSTEEDRLIESEWWQNEYRRWLVKRVWMRTEWVQERTTLRRQSGKNRDCNKSVVVLYGFFNCIITHAFQELRKVEWSGIEIFFLDSCTNTVCNLRRIAKRKFFSFLSILEIVWILH